MFLSEWREFPSAPCLAGKRNLMAARVSMLLKSRASLTCFRACFLPGRAKDLSAPRYVHKYAACALRPWSKTCNFNKCGIRARMGDKRAVYRFLMGKPEGKRTLGIPCLIWKDNIKIVLQQIV